jgi:hypothetical protein
MRLLGWLLTMLISAGVTYGAPELQLRISAFRGSECDSSQTVVAAGSTVMLWLTYRASPNHADSFRYGSTDWMERASVTFDFRASGSNGQSSSIPVDSFRMQEADVYSLKVAREFWRSSPEIIPKDLWRRDYCACITLPGSITGKTLSVSGSLFSDGQRLTSNTDEIKVAPVCSTRDSLMAFRSLVYFVLVGHLHTNPWGYRLADPIEGFNKTLLHGRIRSEKEISDPRGWWRFDRYIGTMLASGWIGDMYFELPEPSPNPLRDYRPLIIEKEARKRGNRDFLKPERGKLGLNVGGIGPEATRDDVLRGSIPRLFAGSQATLYVTWSPAAVLPEYRPFRETTRPHFEGLGDLGPNHDWPKGLMLEAGADPESGQAFVPSADLLREMKPALWLYPGALRADSLYQAHPDSVSTRQNTGREFHFAFTVPTDTGRRVAFRAVYDHERDGRFASDHTAGFVIVAAESRRDTESVIESRIRSFRDLNQNDRALVLADSALKAGHLSFGGLESAASAAFQGGETRKQLNLLDIQYRQFGKNFRQFGCGNGEPEPDDPVQEAQWYLDARKRLVARIEHGEVPLKPPTTLELSVTGWRVSECDSTPNTLLANAQAELDVYFRIPLADTAAFAFRGLENNWPRGLTLELGEAPQRGAEFVPSADIARQLTFQLVRTPAEELHFDGWKGRSFYPGLPAYCFRFTPPAALSGKALAMRASFSNGTGRTLRSADSLVFRIAACCSSEDSSTAAAMPAYFAYKAGDWAYATTTVDSLMASGRLSPLALFVGWRAAHYDKRQEEALRYLDQAYQTYGYVGVVPASRRDLREENEKAYRLYRGVLEGRHQR